MKRNWLWVSVLVLLVISLACIGGGKDKTTPAPTTQPGTSSQSGSDSGGDSGGDAEPTKEVETGGDSGGDTGSDSGSDAYEIDSDAIEKINSYRSTMSMKLEVEGEEGKELAVEQSETREPFATHTKMVSDGQVMEIIRIDNQNWMNIGGTWMQSEATDEAKFGANFSGDDFQPEDEGEYEMVGKENINGINTRHYHMKVSNSALSAAGSALGVNTIESGEADVWIADEANLPKFAVRSLATIKGKTEADKAATLIITMDVTDVNADFTIEPPADAQSSATPDDVPVHPDATDVTAMAGMTFYSVDSELDAIVEFYNTGLADKGWSKVEDSEMTTDTQSMTSWTKDDRTLQLMISKNEEKGAIDVTITISTAE